MALVQTSGLINNIKGSLGGSTFQQTASGLIVRGKPKFAGNKTQSQTEQRVIVSRLNYAWEGFSDSQRVLWQKYANYINGINRTNRGNTSGLSGKNQFFAINSWLLLYEKPMLVTPTFAPPISPITPYYDINHESNDLGQCVGSLDISKCILVTQVSLAQSNATYKSNTGYRTLVYDQSNGTNQNWIREYIDYYGVPLVYNRKYWVNLKVVNFLTGQMSADSEALIRYTGNTTVGIGVMVIQSTFIVG